LPPWRIYLQHTTSCFCQEYYIQVFIIVTEDHHSCSAKDIPKEGQNIGSMSMFGDELLFGDPITEFAGQALGVVVVIYFIFLLLS
jgi:hypothetical protein